MNINSEICLKIESFLKIVFVSFNHVNINNKCYNNDFSREIKKIFSLIFITSFFTLYCFILVKIQSFK